MGCGLSARRTWQSNPYRRVWPLATRRPPQRSRPTDCRWHLAPRLSPLFRVVLGAEYEPVADTRTVEVDFIPRGARLFQEVSVDIGAYLMRFENLVFFRNQ